MTSRFASEALGLRHSSRRTRRNPAGARRRAPNTSIAAAGRSAQRNSAHHRTIVFSGVSTTTDWRFEEDGRELRVRIGPSLATNSGEVAIEHARAGGGLACALGYQVRDLVRSGELEIVLSRFGRRFSDPGGLSVGAFSRRRVRALIDIMAAETDSGFVNLERP